MPKIINKSSKPVKMKLFSEFDLDERLLKVEIFKKFKKNFFNFLGYCRNWMETPDTSSRGYDSFNA